LDFFVQIDILRLAPLDVLRQGGVGVNMHQDLGVLFHELGCLTFELFCSARQCILCHFAFSLQCCCFDRSFGHGYLLRLAPAFRLLMLLVVLLNVTGVQFAFKHMTSGM